MLLHDILSALEERVMPLHLAVQLEEPGALEYAWQHDPIEDVLGVRYRLGLSPRDNATLVEMVERVIPSKYPATVWAQRESIHPRFIADRLREYLDGAKNFAQLQTEVQAYRSNTKVSNWTHLAEAAYHIAMVISAREDQENEHAYGHPMLPRIDHLWDALSLVRGELMAPEQSAMHARLRAGLLVPTADEVFAIAVHHPLRIVQ